MFRWVRRLFGIFGGKADALLDRLEDPKAALDQVVKDMNTEIQQARVALSQAEIQLKKSQLDKQTFEKTAVECRRGAESYMAEDNQYKSKQMLRRAVEAEKASSSYGMAASKLEMDVERLRESVHQKEITYKEAKSKKQSLLTQKRVSENLTRLNRGAGFTDGGNAFAEYERINDKIEDQAAEATSFFNASSDFGGSGDVILLEASVDNEFEELKKRLGKEDLFRIEHKKAPSGE